MALRMRVGLVACRAGFCTQAATGTILGCHLDGELHIGKFLELGIDRFESCRCTFQQGWFIHLFTDDSMRADKGALGALDTQVGFPNGNFEGDVASFPLGGGGGECAIHRESTHGQGVAFEYHDGTEYFSHKVWCFDGGRRTAGDLAGDCMKAP